MPATHFIFIFRKKFRFNLREVLLKLRRYTETQYFSGGECKNKKIKILNGPEAKRGKKLNFHTLFKQKKSSQHLFLEVR